MSTTPPCVLDICIRSGQNSLDGFSGSDFIMSPVDSSPIGIQDVKNIRILPVKGAGRRVIVPSDNSG